MQQSTNDTSVTDSGYLYPFTKGIMHKNLTLVVSIGVQSWESRVIDSFENQERAANNKL